MSGKLYIKINDKLTSKHGVLRDKTLLLYNTITSKHPYDIIYMEGCYAEIIGDYYVSNKFGITITHQNLSFGEIML